MLLLLPTAFFAYHAIISADANRALLGEQSVPREPPKAEAALSTPGAGAEQGDECRARIVYTG